ncbi:MAG: thymidylate synthase, partial [Halobacteria archaeon]|nr:thymidylate synthase [Halobacteria archaeon]
MEEYLSLVSDTLENASYKPNRTGVDTVSSFSQSYKIDLQQGFPLLTTKKLSGYRWNSLIHELLWYFSGEEHIRNLTEKTSIWDPWADDEGRLQSAYGRFWRRYPVPDESSRLDGEAWPSPGDEWVEVEGKREDGDEVLTFDQIGYVVDTLKGD